MNTIAHSTEHDLDRASAALALRIQRALVPAGYLPQVSVYLKTRSGATIPVLEEGEAAIFGDRPSTAQALDTGSTLCLDLEGGEQILVRGADGEAVTVNLVGALLRSSLQALESETREELLLEELGSNWESLEALYEISTHALRFGDIQDALQRLLARLAALQEGLHSALFIRREGLFYPLVSEKPGLAPLTLTELGQVEKALREMKVVMVNDVVESPQEIACWSRATSLAAAPFSWPGSIGFIVVWCEERSCRFDSSFSRVLEAITYQASVMMEGDRLNRRVRESELLAQEVEIASSIQQMLLLANAPKDVPAFEIATCSIPSQHIDGDFHDFFQHPNGTVDVLIGDVMGKGVAAALLGAATKSQFLRATANLALQCGNHPPRPADIVSRAASRLSDRLIALDRFVTLCYARFDVETQTVVYVDCGHTSMVRESKSEGECSYLRGFDLPVGVLPDYKCEQHSTEFRPGETYVLYSDGVTENRSPGGELFGAERLAECIQKWGALGPPLLVERIRQEAVSFRESEKFADDFTCIAVRVKLGQQGVQPLQSRAAEFDCSLESLASFRSWLGDCAAIIDNALAEEDVARLQLACSEIFVNCVMHVPDADRSLPLKTTSHIFTNHLTVEIRQVGPPFSLFSIAPPAFDGSREGGFGIFIVLRSADEAAFSREPDGTNVTTLSFAGSMRNQRS